MSHDALDAQLVHPCRIGFTGEGVPAVVRSVVGHAELLHDPTEVHIPIGVIGQRTFTVWGGDEVFPVGIIQLLDQRTDAGMDGNQPVFARFGLRAAAHGPFAQINIVRAHGQQLTDAPASIDHNEHGVDPVQIVQVLPQQLLFLARKRSPGSGRSRTTQIDKLRIVLTDQIVFQRVAEQLIEEGLDGLLGVPVGRARINDRLQMIGLERGKRKIVEHRTPVVRSLVALDRAVADLGKFSVRPAVVELCKGDRAGNRVRIVVIGSERGKRFRPGGKGAERFVFLGCGLLSVLERPVDRYTRGK